MPEQKIILKYTKKYFQYKSKEDQAQSPLTWDGAQDVMAAYERIEQGIVDYPGLENASPYCAKKLLYFGELLTSFARGSINRSDFESTGLNLEDFDVFTASCLGTLVKAVNNGEYDDAEAEIEKDPEKGGKFVRRKRIGIGMCWLEYCNGWLYCRNSRTPNNLVSGTYGVLPYVPEVTNSVESGSRTDLVATKALIYSLPVDTHTFIIFEANVAAQTKKGFLVSDTKVRVIELPSKILDKFKCSTDYSQRTALGSGINYYFPMYYGYNRDTLKNLYPGGATPVQLYSYAHDVHAYFPFVSNTVTLNSLKNLDQGRVNGVYLVPSPGTVQMANTYPGMPIILTQMSEEYGDARTTRDFIVTPEQSYAFHFGSPASIGFALGYTREALETWCDNEFPKLQRVLIASQETKPNNAFRGVEFVVSYPVTNNFVQTYTPGSCSGVFGDIKPYYVDTSDIMYHKSTGLSDKSLGNKYTYDFVFTANEGTYVKQEKYKDLTPYDDSIAETTEIFHNSVQVGLTHNPEDSFNYVSEGWIWNDTLTQVPVTKAPKTRTVGALQRPDHATDWALSGYFFQDTYTPSVQYPPGCTIGGAINGTYTDIIITDGVALASSRVTVDGESGYQCNCSHISRSGYTDIRATYDRYGFFIPAFCYTGVNINYRFYLEALGFGAEDLVF